MIVSAANDKNQPIEQPLEDESDVKIAFNIFENLQKLEGPSLVCFVTSNLRCFLIVW